MTDSRWTSRPDGDMVVFTFSVPREEIVYFRYVLESYDGLGTQTSVSGDTTVHWRVPASRSEEAGKLIDALLMEIRS